MLSQTTGIGDITNQLHHSTSRSQLERSKLPLEHAPARDDVNMTSHSQPTPCSRATVVRPVSQLSVATTEGSVQRCDDDDEVMRRISRLLRHPLTPTSQEFVGPDSKPLGVEVAINAYRRGEFSSGDVDIDLVPPALRSLEEPDLQDASPFCYGNHQFRELDSPQTAPNYPADDMSVDQLKSARTFEHELENRPWWSPFQNSFFENMIQSLDEALPETILCERRSSDDTEITSSAIDKIERQDQLRSDCHNHLADPTRWPTVNKGHSRNLSLLSTDSAQGLTLTKLTSQNPGPPLHAPPIAPEWVEMLRSQLPQAHHLRDTISCSADQANIHPALRHPAKPPDQDKEEDDSCGSSTIRASILSSPTIDSNRGSDHSANDMASTFPTTPTKSLSRRQRSDNTRTGRLDSEDMLSEIISTAITDREGASEPTSKDVNGKCQPDVSCRNSPKRSSPIPGMQHTEYPTVMEGTKHVSWPTEGSSSMTQRGIRPKSIPDETTSGSWKPQHIRASSKATISKNETYSRAQSMLFAQRPLVPNRPRPSPNPSLRRPSNRGSKLVSNSKLADFFGEEYAQATEKTPVDLETKHDQMVRQLVGGRPKRLSGVGEDVKKGLKRLLG